jgi:hypothetical protein
MLPNLARLCQGVQVLIVRPWREGEEEKTEGGKEGREEGKEGGREGGRKEVGWE